MSTRKENIDLFKGFNVQNIPIPDITFNGSSNGKQGITDTGDNSIDLLEDVKEEELEAQVEDQTDVEEEVEDTEDSTDNEDKEIEEDSSEIEDNGLEEFANQLKEKGIVSFEDKEIKDLDDIEDIISSTINERLNGWVESLPPIVQDLIEYIGNGGNPANYMQAISEVSFSELDLDDDRNSRLVIETYYKSQNWDEDDIKIEIEDLEDAGKLKQVATRHAKVLDKNKENKIQQEIEDQKKAAEQAREEQIKYINTIKDTITSSTDFAGLPVSQVEKKKFTEYMLTPDKQGYTQYAKSMRELTPKDFLTLAYLKYKNFDFSDIEKKATTKATTDLQKKLSSSFSQTARGKGKPQVNNKGGKQSAFDSKVRLF